MDGGPTIVTGTDHAVTIHLPSALQSAVVSYANSDTCTSLKQKKQKRDCTPAFLGVDIIRKTGAGGAFNGLLLPTKVQLPALIPALAGGLQTVITAGKDVVEFSGNTVLLQAVAEICYWIAYEKINNALSLTGDLVISLSDIAISTQVTTTTSNCPRPFLAPDCLNCGGNNGKSKCLGNANGYTCCLCYDPSSYQYAPFKSSDIPGIAAGYSSMLAKAQTQITTSTVSVPSASVGNVVCNSISGSSSCTWKAVDNSSVIDTAQFLVTDQMPTGPMTSGSPNVTQAYCENGNGGTSCSGVTYLMVIGWNPGCTDFASQDPRDPIAGNTDIGAAGLLESTYNNWKYSQASTFCMYHRWPFYQTCVLSRVKRMLNDGWIGNIIGLGGTVTVGCLKYGFYPNVISGVYAAPPQPSLYFAKGTYRST